MKACLYLLDASGSMAERPKRLLIIPRGESRLASACKALTKLLSMEAFNPEDLVGVLAFSGDEVKQVIPLTPKKLIDPSPLKNLKGKGSTLLTKALREALKLLEGVEAEEKAIHLVTDAAGFIGEHPYATLKLFEKSKVKFFATVLASRFKALSVMAERTGGACAFVGTEGLEPAKLYPWWIAMEAAGLKPPVKPPTPTFTTVEARPSYGGAAPRAMMAYSPSAVSLGPVSVPFKYADKVYLAGLGATPAAWMKKCVLTALALTVLPILYVLLPAFNLGWLPLKGFIPEPLDLLLFGLAPLLGFAVQYLRPVLKAGEFASALRRELPWVATLLTVDAATGLPPTASLDKLKERGKVFPGFARLSRMVDKARTVEALDPYGAVEFHANRLTDPTTRDFLLAACTAQRGGSDVQTVLHEKASGVYAEIKGNLDALAEKFTMLATLIFMCFVMLPMFFLSVGPILGGAGGETMVYMLFALNTAFAFMIWILFDATLPKELLVKPSYKPLTLIPLGLGLALILQALTWTGALSLPFIERQHYQLALTLTLPTLLSGVYAYRLRNVQRAMSEAAPSLIRDVAERVKKGESPSIGLKWLAANRSYNKPFDGFLKKAAGRIGLGARICEASREADVPWTVKAGFELLDEADQAGADPSVVDFIAASTNTMFSAMKALKGRVRFFKLSSYICVAVLAFTVALCIMVLNMLVKVSTLGGMGTLSAGVITLPTAEQAEAIASVSMVGAVYSAMLLGLLGGKASGGSIVDGLIHAALSTILCALLLYAAVDLGLIQSLLGGYAPGV